MKNYQVVGIGNAIVDVLSHIEDDFLVQHNIEKGAMQLIDGPRATELYGVMGPAIEISGGSAANTIAGVAMLGLKGAYVGKVKDDQLGEIFSHDLRAQGVIFDTAQAPRDHEDHTARSMILITPDGERSMNTYLGVSATLDEADITPNQMEQTEWLYMEGYLYDKPASQAAFDAAAKMVKAAGGKASITLSDSFCVDRHRDAFLSLIRRDIDLLFCNEHELKSLYETDDLSVALALAGADTEIVACTVGAKGAYILYDGREIHAPATAINVVDATGAGDLFASGFFYGLLNGRDMLTCGRMGCVAAAEIIGHIGARPKEDLAVLFKAQGLV